MSGGQARWLQQGGEFIYRQACMPNQCSEGAKSARQARRAGGYRSKNSSSIFLMYKVSSTLHPTLCRTIRAASWLPSIRTMRLLRDSAVSLAAENVEVVTNRPLFALCRSRLPKKSRIAPEPIYRYAAALVAAFPKFFRYASMPH